MIHKHLEEIVEEDIENLINDGEQEGKTLEYKKDIPSSSESDKQKFLASVLSFVNAQGGDLIFGIEENRETGEPLNHEGLIITNLDQLILRLNQIIRDGVEPIIPANIIRTKSITQSNSKIILIYRISKSWLRPHRIKKTHKFYTRVSNGKVLMGIQELRSEFLSSEYIVERIKSFRQERLAFIINNEGFISVYPSAKVILHIIPLISFETTKLLDISDINRISWSPIYSGSSYNNRINIDGLLIYHLMSDGICSTYLEIFRTGIIEGVETYMLKPDDNEKIIPSPALERELMKSIRDFLSSMNELEIEKPYYIFITLSGVKDYKAHLFGRRYTQSIDRDIIYLPEVLITDEHINIETLLKIPFDALYNALGREKNPYYDDDGTWHPNNRT